MGTLIGGKRICTIRHLISTAPAEEKCSVARVRIYQGTGKVTINDRDIDDYFGLDTLKTTFVSRSFSPVPKRSSTSFAALQAAVYRSAGAIRHGISRALLQYDSENLRATLKKAGFLTRDPRMKERKKYGLKAARRAPQFSKR